MDYDSIAKAGSMLGSGAVIVMDETRCMVQVAAAPVVFLFRRILRPVHAVPRRHGLAVPHGRTASSTARAGRKISTAELASPTTSRAARSARWATPRRCRCARFIKHFRDEFEHHIEHKQLPGAA